MIKWAARYFSSLPPVFVDGALYVFIAIMTAVTAALSSDDASKYITAEHLFWLKFLANGLNAGAVALKMYRSTQYAEHREEKKKNGHSQVIYKEAADLMK